MKAVLLAAGPLQLLVLHVRLAVTLMLPATVALNVSATVSHVHQVPPTPVMFASQVLFTISIPRHASSVSTDALCATQPKSTLASTAVLDSRQS